MKRLSGFLVGVVVGGGLVFGAQRYHVLRTEQGLEVVPKLSGNFSDCYVDIRKFSSDDWSQHKELAAAIIGAKKEHIFHDSAADAVREKMSGFLDELTHWHDD